MNGAAADGGPVDADRDGLYELSRTSRFHRDYACGDAEFDPIEESLLRWRTGRRSVAGRSAFHEYRCFDRNGRFVCTLEGNRDLIVSSPSCADAIGEGLIIVGPAIGAAPQGGMEPSLK